MADKRTDKDDNVKEDCSWQFIQEKIVRRPLSRRQIIRYIILTVICAVLFGTISAVCFTVTKTVAKKIMGQEAVLLPYQKMSRRRRHRYLCRKLLQSLQSR